MVFLIPIAHRMIGNIRMGFGPFRGLIARTRSLRGEAFPAPKATPVNSAAQNQIAHPHFPRKALGRKAAVLCAAAAHWPRTVPSRTMSRFRNSGQARFRSQRQNLWLFCSNTHLEHKTHSLQSALPPLNFAFRNTWHRASKPDFREFTLSESEFAKTVKKLSEEGGFNASRDFKTAGWHEKAAAPVMESSGLCVRKGPMKGPWHQ